MSVPEIQAIVLPRLNQVVDGDSNASLAVLATLGLAIYHQQRTGHGKFIRTSMIAGNALAYSDDFCTYDGKEPIPRTDDDYYGTSAVDRVYEAANGTWLCIAIRSAAEWQRFVAATGFEAAADASDDQRISLMAKLFATREAIEWEALLTGARVGCAAANMSGHPATICYDPALREAGLVVSYEHPIFGEMVRAAPPITFSETPGKVALPCARGQHNRSILIEIGYTDSEIADLESSGVVTPST